jgi:PEP-CTERM motif
MHTRLLLLLSFALVIPSASWAFLGRDRSTSNPLLLDLLPVASPGPGLSGLSGRVNERAAIHILGFLPPPIDLDEPDPNPTPPEGTVPEPTAGLLIALGLTGMAVRRRNT